MVGVLAVGVGVLGVLGLLTVTGLGIRDTRVVAHLYPAVVADAVASLTPAVILVVGLLVAVGLLLSGRDAGRSAIVWLSATGAPVVLVAEVVSSVIMLNEEYDIWLGPPAWTGSTSAMLAMLALITAAITLGVPSGRRWVAARMADRSPVADPGTAPGPLRAAVRRFWFGGVVAIVGAAAVCAPLILIDTEADELTTSGISTLVVGAVLLVTAVVVPRIAALARRGSRTAANLTRAVAD